ITKKYRIREKGYNWKKNLKQLLKIEKQDYLTALNKVSFSVKKGEIFGILGPNGAGKTTLIKILAGLLLPENGKAAIKSYDIFKEREKVRTSVNILMSGGWVVFDYKLSIYNNLKFWGVAGGLRLDEVKKRIEDVLKIVGLDDKRDDFPENLSAGLRQKMNLARCLLSDRAIYLLDEPTSNVDPYSAEFIRKFIKDMKKDGKTVVLATHNLWEAEMLCDRIAILNRGNVLVLDETERIKKRIGKEVLTVDLEKITPGLVKEISSFPFVEKVIEEKNRLNVYGKIKKNMPVLIDTCRKHTNIIGVDMKESSLNGVFIQLITEKEKTMVIK
ncbi:MAG: ATP-binding cassette domain-containing protein, partial [Candidatus Thermoplasmatota archaeon]|nr:ATP-binding cassette domain-containing protein [Candidatus Thermoplasmatota archaeon]